jgi:hypothetical protein
MQQGREISFDKGKGEAKKGRTEFLSAQGLRVGVESEEDGLVDERVLLLCPRALLHLLASRTHDGLDFFAVDQASDVGVGDLGRGETAKELATILSNHESNDIQIVLLVQRRFIKGAEDIIKQLESALCPDNKPAKVSTRGELEEVESPHIHQLYTWQVTESLDNTIILVVHDQWATTLAMAAAAHLTLASTQFPRVGHLDDVSVSVQRLEERHSLLSLFEGLDR